MVKENFIGQMVKSTKVIGFIIKCMDMEPSNGLMVATTLVNIIMIKSMEWVNSSGQIKTTKRMERYMKECGKEENNME